MNAHLEIFAPDGSPRVVPLGNTATLGRSRENSVCLAGSPQVSRQHALVRCHNGYQYQIVDLGSRNGTFVDDVRVLLPVTLRDGARIRVGHFEIRFVQREADPADETLDATIGTTIAGTRTGPAPTAHDVALMVCDVRGFSTMSEQVEPGTMAQFLGAWFREAGNAVVSRGGTVDKFIGDAMFAYWSPTAPTEAGHCAAAEAALAAGRTMLALADQLAWPGSEAPFRIVVALHQGKATLSNIGLDAARDATIIGDSVNTVFRLESVAKESGCALVASADLLERTGGTAAFRNLGEHQLKGKTRPVRVFGL